MSSSTTSPDASEEMCGKKRSTCAGAATPIAADDDDSNEVDEDVRLTQWAKSLLRPHMEDVYSTARPSKASDQSEELAEIIEHNQISTSVDGVQRGPISEDAIDSQAAEWQLQLHKFVASRERRRVLFDTIVDQAWDAGGRLRFATIPLYFLQKSITFSDIFIIGEHQDESMYLPHECRIQFMDSVKMSVVDRSQAEDEFVAKCAVIGREYLRGTQWRGLSAVDPAVLKHFSLAQESQFHGKHLSAVAALSSSSSSTSASYLPPISSSSMALSSPAASTSLAETRFADTPSVDSTQSALTKPECETLVSSGLALEYEGKYDEALKIWLRLYSVRHHYGLFKIGVRYLRGWRMPLSIETAIYLFEQAVVAGGSSQMQSLLITPAVAYLLRMSVVSPAREFGEWLLMYWTARWLSQLLSTEMNGELPVPWSLRVYREAGARYSGQPEVRIAHRNFPVNLAQRYVDAAFTVAVVAPFVDIDLLWMTPFRGKNDYLSPPPSCLLEHRYPPALYAEGEDHMPETGSGKCDLVRAAEMFDAAAAAGVVDACYRLGCMYAHGYAISPGTEEANRYGKKNLFTLDRAKARELFTRAAKAGYPEAEKRLEWLKCLEQSNSKGMGKSTAKRV